MSNYFESLDYFNNKLNLSFISVVNKSEIIEDTRKAIQKINITMDQVATPIQEHTNIVRWADSSGVYKKCDGVVTNLKYNIILSLSVADCTPVCLFDPVSSNYALIHSGWRGTCEKVVNNAIQLILSKGSKLEDILVYLGPSISQKNYEVDIDVASCFSKGNYVLKGKKYLLDIKSQIKNDIIEVGIKLENVYSSNRCTYQESNLCSYRRDGTNAGRMIFLMGKYSGRN
tara:strand:+ start:456 stop:1142 length:687 start_codon:yes stop_codon:yes gene_type:complete